MGGWGQVASPASPLLHGQHPWAVAKHAQQPSLYVQAVQAEPVDNFLQELGITPEEDIHFAWIAEYGLQNDVMPPRWTMHADASTGVFYYVDADLGTSSWENPLTECLKVIVDIGRRYLAAPTDTFFQEQKDTLWEEHKIELAGWHGPLADEHGRQYYTNSGLGVSTWHDPRDETQFMFEIESQLLDALEETLFGLGPEDLPTFGGADSEQKPWSTEPVLTESGAEVWTLDSAEPQSPEPQSPWSPSSPSSPNAGKKNRRGSVKHAADFDVNEHRTTFERMSKDLTFHNNLCRDAIEVQELTIRRKMKERQQRKQEALDAIDRAKRDEEAVKMALINAEEEKKAEVLRQIKEEQRRAEEALQQKLADEEAARKEEEKELRKSVKRNA